MLQSMLPHLLQAWAAMGAGGCGSRASERLVR